MSTGDAMLCSRHDRHTVLVLFILLPAPEAEAVLEEAN